MNGKNKMDKPAPLTNRDLLLIRESASREPNGLALLLLAEIDRLKKQLKAEV